MRTRLVAGLLVGGALGSGTQCKERHNVNHFHFEWWTHGSLILCSCTYPKLQVEERHVFPGEARIAFSHACSLDPLDQGQQVTGWSKALWLLSGLEQLLALLRTPVSATVEPAPRGPWKLCLPSPSSSLRLITVELLLAIACLSYCLEALVSFWLKT